MSTTHDDGGPVFPCDAIDLGVRTIRSEGMCLRDYFAAKAMQAAVTACAHDSHEGLSYCDHVAKVSYEMADSMLKARSQ
jgi:hypothetical protein